MKKGIMSKTLAPDLYSWLCMLKDPLGKIDNEANWKGSRHLPTVRTEWRIQAGFTVFRKTVRNEEKNDSFYKLPTE